ncbi:MAG: MFS transporter, partial [Victivallales bacterium]|nr:MFS transporter [Victivallales bacterium]
VQTFAIGSLRIRTQWRFALTRFLIFLFPALADMLLGMAFFVASVRIAESDASALAVTAVTAVWAVVYMIASHVIGRFANPANCARLIVSGCAILAVSSVLFVVFPNLNATYPIMSLLSIGTALFFIPFQVFMKAVDKGDDGALPRSVGLYTFAWSSGMAAGPFIGANIWNYFGWRVCYFTSAVFCVIIALGVLMLKHHAKTAGDPPPSSDEKLEQGKPDENSVDYLKMPDLAWLGWVCSGVGCVTVAVLRSYLPSSATVAGISRGDQGILLFLISASQALTGLALCRSRTWMYEVVPTALFACCGVAALFVFGLSTSFYPLAAAALFYGIYSGSFFFYFVFHSLVHPEHSTKYIGINESVVGLTAIVGPLLAGFLADGVSVATPYLSSAGLVAVAMIFQAVVHAKNRSAL